MLAAEDTSQAILFFSKSKSASESISNTMS